MNKYKEKKRKKERKRWHLSFCISPRRLRLNSASGQLSGNFPTLVATNFSANRLSTATKNAPYFLPHLTQYFHRNMTFDFRITGRNEIVSLRFTLSPNNGLSNRFFFRCCCCCPLFLSFQICASINIK